MIAKIYIGVAGITTAALVVYNVRWKHVRRRRPKILSVETVVAVEKKEKTPPIILLHGMWHGAWYWKPLQRLLAEKGFTSHAISLEPGERFLPGGSQQELIADLEKTLASISKSDTFLLLGHSQGGLLAQAAVYNSPNIRKKTSGLILLGTFPYRYIPPWSDVQTLLQRPQQHMYTFPGYTWICLFGKLWSADYTKQIFLLPTTDITTSAMKEYIAKLLKAPSDGLITMSHFVDKTFVKIDNILNKLPTLILGASHDVIYPPDLLRNAFEERYTNATHVVVQNQAHCFMDPGWEQSMINPLIEWLEALEN